MTPSSTDVLLIRRIDVIREDLTFVKILPTTFIFLEILHKGIKECVTMRVGAKFIPDSIWEPIFARIWLAKRILKPSHCLN